MAPANALSIDKWHIYVVRTSLLNLTPVFEYALLWLQLQVIIGYLDSQMQNIELDVARLLVADNLAWTSANMDEVGDMLYALTGLPNPDLPDGPTTSTLPTSPTTSTTTPATSTRPSTRPTTQPTTAPPTSPAASTEKPNAASTGVANVVLLMASIVFLQRVAV